LLQAKCNRPTQGRSIRNSKRKRNSLHFNRHGTEESWMWPGAWVAHPNRLWWNLVEFNCILWSQSLRKEISVSISLQDWMANSPPSPRFDCFPRMLSQVCKPCIWEELKRRAFGFLHPVLVLQLLLSKWCIWSMFDFINSGKKKKKKKKKKAKKKNKKKKRLMGYWSPKSLLVLAVAPTKAVVKKFKCLQTLLSETCLQKL
jgi:hypothetical protein